MNGHSVSEDYGRSICCEEGERERAREREREKEREKERERERERETNPHYTHNTH